MYALGIDLGTTYTAAATWRNGHVEIASLGSRAAVIPSVVLAREDHTFLTGETANRRGLTEPHRLAREFKRRLGDTTPILLGGAPYSAETLMARLLRAVVDDVASREGGQPVRVCVSHPANWGEYKQDLLRQAVRIADVAATVSLVTEPEAAAVCYAHQQRVEPGSMVAVYDLGGGTFDASVLRKTAAGFELIGQPEGIERLGGIDFDAAVFAHVSRSLGGALSELDEDEPAAVAAVGRLREECVEAKEALSTDTDTSIPVLLPNLTTDVRLNRAELEDMVRPALLDTIEALRRALRSAQLTADQLHSVLLVGGSSRMPIVAQLVGAELDRPVAVDAHPKHAVALGAAWLAGNPAGDPLAGSPVVPAVGSAAVSAPPPTPAPARSTDPGQSTAPLRATAPARSTDPGQSTAPLRATTPARSTDPARSTAPPPSGEPPLAPARSVGRAALAPAPPLPPLPPAATRPPGEPSGKPGPGRSRARLWLPRAAAAGVIALLVAGAVALAQAGSEDPPVDPLGGQAGPVEEQCTDTIRANPRWVCLTGAQFAADGSLVIDYEVQWADVVPDKSAGYHLHLYAGDGTSPPAESMGNQALALGLEPGRWYIEDQQPAVIPADQVDSVIGEAPMVCARIAGPTHELVPDTDDGYTTGNCTTITR